jgi:hypothetical protein
MSSPHELNIRFFSLNSNTNLRFHMKGRSAWFLFLTPMATWAQSEDPVRANHSTDSTWYVMTTLDEFGETIPWILLADVHLSKVQYFSSPEARARYMRLRYNVMKVLPYARFAQERYQQLNKQLAMTSNKKAQRQLVKACEVEIKEMFNKEIKNLTITQGKILIKLIDRETGRSSYQMVKELRGGVNAFFYQSIAKVFGHNLKAEYDPQEDREIEMILRSLPQQASIPTQ